MMMKWGQGPSCHLSQLWQRASSCLTVRCHNVAGECEESRRNDNVPRGFTPSSSRRHYTEAERGYRSKNAQFSMATCVAMCQDRMTGETAGNSPGQGESVGEIHNEGSKHDRVNAEHERTCSMESARWLRTLTQMLAWQAGNCCSIIIKANG